MGQAICMQEGEGGKGSGIAKIEAEFQKNKRIFLIVTTRTKMLEQGVNLALFPCFKLVFPAAHVFFLTGIALFESLL